MSYLNRDRVERECELIVEREAVLLQVAQLRLQGQRRFAEFELLLKKVFASCFAVLLVAFGSAVVTYFWAMTLGALK